YAGYGYAGYGYAGAAAAGAVAAGIVGPRFYRRGYVGRGYRRRPTATGANYRLPPARCPPRPQFFFWITAAQARPRLHKKTSAAASSTGEQTELAQHRPHVDALAREGVAQASAVQVHLGPEVPGEIGAPLRGLGGGRQHALPERDLRRGEPGRPARAAPRSDLAIHALLPPGRRRRIRAGKARRRGDADGAQPPRRKLRHGARRGNCAEIGVARDDVGDRVERGIEH